MSQYIVSARKYRPQRFEDVVGQQHVTGTLKNALNKDQLAHALLFCGPRGVGKTTCARILAKALNCLNPTEDHEPCNECSMCEAMNKNASFNVVELDAASNNTVDHIRSLNEQIRIAPQTGDYKVYIIDEVHMLSLSAFNAFLKTLEEPPPYAIFILATTEKHKILPTILSRCQIYDFKRIQVNAIRNHLATISEKEGIEAERDALQLIAMKADGALRDALSIYDRIVSAVGKEIHYADVVDQLNILDYEYFFKVTDALIIEDLPEVFKIFDEIFSNGFQPDHFILGLGSHLRDLLMCQYKGTHALLEFSENLVDRYMTQAQAIDKSFLIKCLHIINESSINYQRAKNKRLHVEMALMHICFSSRYESKEISAGSNTGKKKQQLDPRASSTQSENPTTSDAVKKETTRNREETTASVLEETPPEDSTSPGDSVKEKPVKQAPTNVEKSAESDTVKPSNKPRQTPLKRKKSSAIPSLGSLESLESKADEKRKLRETNLVDFTQDNLEAFIRSWSQKITNPSAAAAMKNSNFFIKDKQIVNVLIGSRTDGTIIKNDSGLLADMREHFMKPEIRFSFEIDDELQKKRNADKPLTAKENLEKLRKENPKVRELQQKLDLEIKE